MKRGRDEGKIMGPMFPRLHVNDTEKGGPRAPPRNKMALYEQLTIPSHRLTDSAQGVSSDTDAIFPYKPSNRHQSENICGQYSDFSIPLSPVSWRKKSDEEDFRVPIFNDSVRSQERRKCGNDPVQEKVNHPSKFHKFKRTGMLESNMRQEGKSQTEKNSQALAFDRAKALSNSSSIEKQNGSPIFRERRDCPAKSVDRLQTRDAIEPKLRPDSERAGNGCTTSLLEKASATLDERNSSAPFRDQRNSCDLGNNRKRSVAVTNLDMADSVSEISLVESIAGPDMTPDDVVGIIGPKHFWKARKAILNQQRVFAIQVFELHRLIKVQRSIAESPQMLADNSVFVDKPDLASPVKPIPNASKRTASPIKAFPAVSKKKPEPKKASQNKESPVEKASFSTGHGGPWCFNQPQGHQWLIPVMTPSEGLVYKPYPGPGFVGPNPTMGSFLPPPGYGIPPHYQGCYFSPYAMSAAAVSGSSVEQTNPPQSSRASSPVERLVDSGGSNDMERGNVLPLFPVAPDSSPARSKPESEPDRPARVIRVVPHNATSATESAARIFRSIQEERRRYDSV